MAGTSNYPGALDDFAEASPTNLGDDDSTGRNHSERHDDVEAAMEAVQGELGVDPAGPSASTVAARFTAIDSALTGKASASVTITAGNGLTGGGDLSADRTISASFSATNPVVNGAAAPGSADALSRGDHVHPNDTTKADLASPTFTGVPAAPTASVGTNTTQVATTAFVNSEIANDAILLNTVTASAQLLVGAGSASVAALSSGSAGQVLTVSGSATYGLAWLDATGGGGATVVMSPDEPVDQENGTLWVDTDSDVPTFTASAYVLNSLFANKGTLAAASGANTPAALSVGTNDHLLVAASGETTGLKWAALTAAQIPTLDATKVPTLVQNAQTDSYTLVLGDAGKLIEMGKATAQTLTIPLNSSVAFPTGTKIDVIQTGAGETTIAGDGGVTVDSEGSKLKINAQWQAVTLIKRATDTWVLIGALKT